MRKGKSLQLIVIGLLIISGSQIVGHYLKMPDSVSGILMGIGIGLMIFSLLRQKLRPTTDLFLTKKIEYRYDF